MMWLSTWSRNMSSLQSVSFSQWAAPWWQGTKKFSNYKKNKKLSKVWSRLHLRWPKRNNDHTSPSFNHLLQGGFQRGNVRASRTFDTLILKYYEHKQLLTPHPKNRRRTRWRHLFSWPRVASCKTWPRSVRTPVLALTRPVARGASVPTSSPGGSLESACWWFHIYNSLRSVDILALALESTFVKKSSQDLCTSRSSSQASRTYHIYDEKCKRSVYK